MSQMQHRRNMSNAFQMGIPGEKHLNLQTRRRNSKRKCLSPITVGSLWKGRAAHLSRLSSQAWSGSFGVSDLDRLISSQGFHSDAYKQS